MSKTTFQANTLMWILHSDYHESVFKLTYRKIFKQYSIHSQIGIHRESKMVLVVGLKVYSQLHLYLLMPLESNPILTKSSDSQ